MLWESAAWRVKLYNLYLGAYQGFAQPAGGNAVVRLQAKLNVELNAFNNFINTLKTRRKRSRYEG